jgi:hypothetical protein
MRAAALRPAQAGPLSLNRPSHCKQPPMSVLMNSAAQPLRNCGLPGLVPLSTMEERKTLLLRSVTIVMVAAALLSGCAAVMRMMS